MIEIKEYYRPKSVKEAYEKLVSIEGAEIIGSGAFMRLSSRKIDLAIDLQDAGLNYVKIENDEIKIGGATTLGEIERNEIIKEVFNGELVNTLQTIWSVQLRNIATVGGTIFPRLGFSDLITVLLALNTDVVLYNNGRMPLEVFLEEKIRKDILVELAIKKENRKLSFQYMRNSFYDFSILNTAVSVDENKDFRIAIGARPAVASLAKKAMNYLKENDNIEEAAKIAAEEMTFGSNIKGSKEYREMIAPVLVRRGLEEVLR